MRCYDDFYRRWTDLFLNKSSNSKKPPVKVAVFYCFERLFTEYEKYRDLL